MAHSGKNISDANYSTSSLSVLSLLILAIDAFFSIDIFTLQNGFNISFKYVNFLYFENLEYIVSFV